MIKKTVKIYFTKTVIINTVELLTGDHMRFFIAIIIFILLTPFPSCAENISINDFVGQWRGISAAISGRERFDFYDNGYIINHSTSYSDSKGNKPQQGVYVELYRHISATHNTLNILVLRNAMTDPHTYIYRLHKGGKSPNLAPDELGITVYGCNISATDFLSFSKDKLGKLGQDNLCNFENGDYLAYARHR